MIVYKATRDNMTCTSGKGVFRYRLEVPATADGSKCGNTGLHACEYVIDCTTYYGLNGSNRFFKANAEGDIAEDGANTRIACTKLTLIQELTNRDIAREAMLYMARHPKRDGWRHKSHMIDIDLVAAEMSVSDGIAIARGEEPQVRGCKGSHLGLLMETDGQIKAAKLITVDGETIQPGIWYTVGMLEEMERRGQA